MEQYNQETAGYKSIINAALEVLLETCPPFIPEGTETGVERFKGEDSRSFTLNDKIFNPEMSWLAFNWRVLAAAADENIPAFERLRFLAISGRNLDEFFARVGALKRQESVGVGNLVKKRGKNIWSPRKTLEYVSAEVEKMSDIQAELYIEQIAPSLADYNIRILCRAARYGQGNGSESSRMVPRLCGTDFRFRERSIRATRFRFYRVCP